ncbi:hypothetical protein CAPTEDRAFT_197871, partial [Capitella teleta]
MTKEEFQIYQVAQRSLHTANRYIGAIDPESRGGEFLGVAGVVNDLRVRDCSDQGFHERQLEAQDLSDLPGGNASWATHRAWSSKQQCEDNSYAAPWHLAFFGSNFHTYSQP